jgi:hypothetical protein
VINIPGLISFALIFIQPNTIRYDREIIYSKVRTLFIVCCGPEGRGCRFGGRCRLSDDLVHSQVQSVGLQAEQSACDGLEPARSIKNEAPFSLVIMLDGWMVRERGPQWAAPPDCQDAQRVEWHEVKSGVICRLDHRAQTASGRGALTQKKVVACPPGTEVLEFGAAVQQQALRCGVTPGEHSQSTSQRRLQQLCP